MKTAILAIPLLCQIAVITPAAAQTPSVEFTPSPAGPLALTLRDDGDRAWIVEVSSDLSNWSPVRSLKIHNGYWTSASLPDFTAASRFYRAVEDTTSGAAVSTLAGALGLPDSPYNYAAPVLPAAFRQAPIVNQDNTPVTNPTTDAGALLGRVLFYDKRLSANRTVACASCHQQEHGFSDPRRFSTGFTGGQTSRNSMGLSNARWYLRRNFFWDERAETLEDQVLQPIQNAVEMGMTLEDLTERLSVEPYYAELFTGVFGSPEVTSDRISRALAQFVRSVVSVRSKYDAGVASGFANFTAEEALGRRIFLGQTGNATCVTCHGTDNFVPGNAINNNGLENPYTDKGLGGITGRTQDEGLFKVPSLRNIALTAPYMHDGRFATLEEVVEFYNSGVVNHPNLSPPLRNPRGAGQPGGPLRLNLTAAQKAALVAFLRTLTDESLATDPKFADPFRYGD